jgi:uncharacterized protein YcnI
MNRSAIALATAGATLALAPVAGAHVTVHPNLIPEESFAVLNVRVPNETDDANTTKIQVQLPDGFFFASAAPPPGWKVAYKSEKLATPVKTDDGEVSEQVTQVTFSGGKIAPGQFQQFPLSVGVPGESGDTLTFKTLQTYDNGDVARWIGAPDADEPAPTVVITPKDGVIQDTGGEGVPKPPSTETAAAPAAAPATKVVEKKESKGLSLIALIVGGLGLLAGGFALSSSRRA